MYQRDYVLRLIERLAGILIALRNRMLRRDAEQPVTPAEIHDVAQQAGLDLEIARRLDPAMLLMWLSPTGESDPARLWLMAELLYLTGLLAGPPAEGGGRGDFERATAILARLPEDWRPSPDFCTAAERISELRDLIARHRPGG